MKRVLIAGALIALATLIVLGLLFSRRSPAPEAGPLPSAGTLRPPVHQTDAVPPFASTATPVQPSLSGPQPQIDEPEQSRDPMMPSPTPAPPVPQTAVVPPLASPAIPMRPPVSAPQPRITEPVQSREPMRPLPTPPPPIVTKAFPADEVLTSLASIAFNAPEQMQLGERRIIQLLLDPRQTIPALLGREVSEPGRVESARIRISESIEARLSGGAFDIHPVTPELQALSAESATEWKWEVQPKESGRHRLFMTINAVIEESGQKRTIRTFDREIQVYVPPTAMQRAVSKSSAWTPIVLIAVLIVLFFFVRRRRTKPLPASHDQPTVKMEEDSSGRLEPGQVIAGRYEIERALGRGGMGIVYAARDREFNGERIAIKTILPQLAAGERAVERFKREIQYARRVAHPNVCRIFDVGYDGARMFVTMEYVEGITLSDLIRTRGPLSEEDAIPIVEQIAAALDETHRAGLVHRDLKTGNIMLADEGRRAVLMDFGLACLATGPSSVESLTQTGAVVGSPMYMAPEQLEGGDVTPATDIYALGTVLYEMLTAALPFEGGTPVSLIARRLSEPPIPPSRRMPSISATVEAVILKCLARDPRERFQRAGEVVRALENAVSTQF